MESKLLGKIPGTQVLMTSLGSFRKIANCLLNSLPFLSSWKHELYHYYYLSQITCKFKSKCKIIIKLTYSKMYNVTTEKHTTTKPPWEILDPIVISKLSVWQYVFCCKEAEPYSPRNFQLLHLTIWHFGREIINHATKPTWERGINTEIQIKVLLRIKVAKSRWKT